jgi:ribosomal protein S18 acetylase RimI-like enzyme
MPPKPRSVPTVAPADGSLLDAIKGITDAHRHELGFHTRASLLESVARKELLVALLEGRPVGFTRFHHTRRRYTTLQEIATLPSARRQGVGRALVGALEGESRRAGSRLIRLSCPADLPANAFYRALGFRPGQSRPGKARPLFEWQLPLLPARPLLFVASLTNAGNDLRHLLPLWEREGPAQRPFDHCIVTPLFMEPRELQSIRHMHQSWGVRIWFDSGGFYVQQGKIAYEELFHRLLGFYRANDWGEVYVLPDYVPTSRSSPAQIEESVRVTAAEGVKFARRLPAELRPRALGVLQGHQAEHLQVCLDAFLAQGIEHLGFGSFDTNGVNAEINLFTQDAARRLRTVSTWLEERYLAGRVEVPPRLHLFGVGTPNLLASFPGFLATSFDSSGWMRTAGYGSVYLPYRGRRNVTHGGLSLTSGAGLTARAFYAECEASGHQCPFCSDFRRLQEDRYVRMWHNALVFDEMTRSLPVNASPAE